MRILLVDNHSEHLDDLIAILPDVPEVTDFSKLYTYDLDERELVVISGSYQYSYRSSHLESEREAIRATDTPVIGICLGCQLLAKAYGDDHLWREEEQIKGIISIKMIGNNDVSLVYEAHSRCINQLGSSFIPIAVSEYGYEIIKHEKKRHRGLQFHPEVILPVNDGKKLFDDILYFCMER